MDENEIFRPVNESQKEAGIEPEALSDNPIISPPPPELPSFPVQPMLFKILKVLLGIVIVLGIIFTVYNVVLPKIFPARFNVVTLTYWGVLEDASVYAPVIADFQKKHPNIKIEYLKQDKDRYKDKLITRYNNGNAPDIFSFHNTWVPEFSKLLLPIPESVVSVDEFSKNYYPVAKTDLVNNGVIYGIPLEMDTLNLFVNRGLFQAAGLNPPATWIDFVNSAKQLTVKDENNTIKTAGAAMGTYSNINHAPDIISILFVQSGVSLADISSNLPATIDALRFYASFALPNGNIWSDTQDQSLNAFASGSLAMYFGYSWDFSAIKSLNPNLSFDIYPVPSLPGKNITVASYWVEGISGKSKHQKEALLFMEYLSSKETMQKLFAAESKVRSFGQPYARADLAQALSNSVAYSFVQSAPSAVSSFFVDGTNDNSGINFQLNSCLKTAVDSILGGLSPEMAAENLSKETSKILKQYGQ